MADKYDGGSGTVFFKGRKPVSEKRVLAVAKEIRAVRKKSKKA
jgi:hypothetical protein